VVLVEILVVLAVVVIMVVVLGVFFPVEVVILLLLVLLKVNLVVMERHLQLQVLEEMQAVEAELFRQVGMEVPLPGAVVMECLEEMV
tara:strand:- start:237 stop:497 length:261 start_codon:yes stop_codon:yes gene_type:complete